MHLLPFDCYCQSSPNQLNYHDLCGMCVCAQPGSRTGEAPTSLKAMAAQVVASASREIIARQTPLVPQPPSATSGSSEVFTMEPANSSALKSKSSSPG